MANTGASVRNRGFRPEIALLGAAIVLFLVALASALLAQTSAQHREAWLEQTRHLRNDVDYLGTLGQTTSSGGSPPFGAFLQRQRFVTTRLQGLAKGNAVLGTLALPTRARADFDAMLASWEPLRAEVDQVMGMQKTYIAAWNALTALEGVVSETLQRYEQVAERLANQGAPAAQIYLVAGQMIRLERLRGLAKEAISGGAIIDDAARELQAEAETFVRNNEALLGSGGDFVPVRDGQADQLLRSINQDFASALTAIATLREASAGIAGLREAAARLPTLATASIQALEALESRIIYVTGGGVARLVLINGSGLLAIVLLFLFLYWLLRDARSRARLAEERDVRQQGAILSLLDEITNLADGDLTVEVTVTEDFTGAIADSINYTVDTLRRLVGTINDTSVEIAAAASSTQDTAQKMNQASERQARDIGNVANVITQTARSLTQVATRAEEIAQDAANSVQVAHNGAGTVGRTIQGMASLREQIQETAKRIKRLGESSQEIGNIIEFINDIAEQTNTLALNASIQAAMAGEAGRGFAVVADEVQRLAERAAGATRQIETLIKTIQADTTEAIISMERSTANVITGARSAEEAGQALTKIETTSTEVARLIQDIASAARSQSAQATKIAGQMQTIRDIAVQTSGSAGQTARAVGELTNLSEKLRESVAGFKLPLENAAGASMALPTAA